MRNRRGTQYVTRILHNRPTTSRFWCVIFGWEMHSACWKLKPKCCKWWSDSDFSFEWEHENVCRRLMCCRVFDTHTHTLYLFWCRNKKCEKAKGIPWDRAAGVGFDPSRPGRTTNNRNVTLNQIKCFASKLNSNAVIVFFIFHDSMTVSLWTRRRMVHLLHPVWPFCFTENSRRNVIYNL